MDLKLLFSKYKNRLIIFLAVFGPATITAMADNDASGVATYSIAGAVLGYPILFILVLVTILLAITQEMGIRLALVTGKGLGDVIRERNGIKQTILVFICLFIANMGTIVTDLAAMKTTSEMFHIPSIPLILVMLVIVYLFVVKGNYKLTQRIMLIACLFYIAYIFSAFKAKPDWSLALGNLIYPHGLKFDFNYIKNYLVIGMGVLGTTVTPWGQFFISSFAYDKKLTTNKLKYSQFETYWGAFLTDFFSFFMIVATAATLFVHHIPLISGEQAALAIKPFAGEMAGLLFGLGILNAGFMGIVIVSLSTAYAFSEFFGYSGSLDTPLEKSRLFYMLFLIQLVISSIVVFIPGISLFNLAIASQVLNAVTLPFIFFYLIKFTNSPKVMGEYTNNNFQKNFAVISTIIIVIASIFTMITLFFR